MVASEFGGQGARAPSVTDMTRQLRLLEAENAELRATIEAMRAEAELLQRVADSDTLTPLLNRRCFLREVERALAAMRRYGTPAVLIFGDVDGLKAINDAHGHAAGDAALIHVAQLLTAHVRATDLVARIAGDEFGLLLEHLDETAATAKAQLLADAIAAAPLRAAGKDIAVAVSLGMTPLQADDTVEAVLARADAEMYAARRRSRADQ